MKGYLKPLKPRNILKFVELKSLIKSSYLIQIKTLNHFVFKKKSKINTNIMSINIKNSKQ